MNNNNRYNRDYEREPLSPREKADYMMPLIISVALVLGIWVGLKMGGSSQQQQFIIKGGDVNKSYEAPAQIGKVGEILKFVSARYVEEVDLKLLQDAAVKGMLNKLDPHSNYIPTSDVAEVNEKLAGGFEGIGIEFAVLDDTVFVVGVIPDGPSEKAGIQVGDKIMYIGDSLVSGKGINSNGVIAYLKGKGGKPVDLELQRRGEDDLVKLTVIRGQIPMTSVDVAYMLDEKTAYIKINRFSGKTFEEFTVAARELAKEGMENLVLDLRNNPGGYLNAATDILSEFFQTKTKLVHTEGRTSNQRKEYFAGQSLLRIPFKKIAVLINEGSASASEIIAGAIQDNDRGIILGRRSFGKGLVQEQYELHDGSALRLTVAKYFTPSGRLIQKPYSDKVTDYNDEMLDRRTNGELYYRDSIKILDSVEYKTSAGRTVYGGGGIIPDIFIPADSLDYNTSFVHLKFYVSQFVYRYMDRNFEKFTQYEDLDQFINKFQVTDAMMDEFIAFSKLKLRTVDTNILLNGKQKLRQEMKAVLGQQLFRSIGLYKVLHQEDEMVQKALEEINAD
ncbi:MAG: S41 family peptidase [Saprospiraceae bacterium]|nr:S41 family peptidase [Saprospiraceae bacterium]